MESTPQRLPSGASGTAPRRVVPFIGRDRELAVLAESLEAAALGHSGIVLVGGEPGVGKSRLLSEFGDSARAAGWLVLTGRSYDTEGMPPYLAFAEAIAEYLRTAVDDEAGSRLASAAGEVALLIPELSARLKPGDTQPSFGPEADRYRLFEAVCDFFLHLPATSETAGLLLCLEDLHWADRSTLLLLQHMVRKLKGTRVLLVGTFRTEEVDRSRPLFDVLAEMAREQQDQRLTLSRLSSHETSALIASLSGDVPAPELVAAIHRQTEGNPFFVQEVVRHRLSQSSSLGGGGSRPEDWGLSEGVRQVIEHRLSRLGAETQRLLQVAAVLGDGFDAALLRAAADAKAAAITEALEEAAQAGMLREGDAAYVFGHPLIRQVIYESLSLARRQDLHLRAAQAIETLRAGSLQRHVSPLATHYRLAGAAADPAKTLDCLVAAGDAARAIFAYHEAISLYRYALSADQDAAARGPGFIAEIQVKLGTSLEWIGSAAEAMQECRAALEGLTSDQVEQRIEVLLSLSYQSYAYIGDSESSSRYASEALAAARSAGMEDQITEAMAALASAEVIGGNLREGVDHLAVAVTGRGFLAKTPRMAAASSIAYFYWAGRLGEAVDLGRKLPDSPAPQTLLAAKGGLGLALASSGRYDEAQAVFDEARRIGEEHPVGALARSISMSSGYHLDLFDFAGAESLADEARSLAINTSSFRQTLSQTGIDLVLNFCRSGQIGRAEALIDDVIEAVSQDRSGPHIWLLPMRLAEARAELCLGRHDWPQALSFADDVIARSRRHGRVKYVAIGLQTRARALLGLGRKREAILDLREAVAVARPVGDPAMLLHAAAALLGVEPGASTVDEARAAIDRILEGLSDIEMRRIFLAAAPVQLVYSLAASNSRVTQRPAYPDGLTEREVEVLRSIASGNSNRETAESLVLSVRTVERHITNIYSKIGARGKADATAYALNHSLT